MTSLKRIHLLPLLAVPMFSVQAIAGNSHHDWASVLEARPVTQTLRVPVDHQVCWDEQVNRRIPQHRSATPLILGAVIGGVIGNQFGGGSGKTALTLAGAALGTSVAADQQIRRHPSRYYTTTEQRCAVETDWRSEERIVAWDVAYEYRGEVYHTRMREAPGDRIRVRVTVDPVGTPSR